MSYLIEAFKALNALDEDVFSVSDDGIEKLSAFEDDDTVSDDITIYDVDAENESELEDSYIGKIILDCNVCHSKLYKDKADVVIDEESNDANIDMECPYCYSVDGFKIIGEVAPFAECLDPSKSVKESLKNRKRKMNKKTRLKEDYEDDVKDAMTLPIVRERVASDVYDELNGYDYTGPHEEEIDDIIDLLLDDEELPDYVVMDNNVDEMTWDSATNTLRLPAERVGKAEIDNLFEFQASAYVEQNPDMYPDEDDDFDESLHESVDLATKENTVAGVLAKHMPELYAITDVNELRKAVIDIVDNSDIADKAIVSKLRRDLFSKKSVGALLSTIATYMTGTKVAKVGRKNEDVEDTQEESAEDNLGTDLEKYQKWVDYDMKKYHKISNKTNSEIRKAGLQIVKDKYGDYQVTAGKYDESLKESDNSLNDEMAVKMSRDDFARMCRENGILKGLSSRDYEEIRDLFNIGYEDFDAAVNDLWDGDGGYHSRDWYEDLLKKYTNSVNESLKESLNLNEAKNIINVLNKNLRVRFKHSAGGIFSLDRTPFNEDTFNKLIKNNYKMLGDILEEQGLKYDISEDAYISKDENLYVTIYGDTSTVIVQFEEMESESLNESVNSDIVSTIKKQFPKSTVKTSVRKHSDVHKSNPDTPTGKTKYVDIRITPDEEASVNAILQYCNHNIKKVLDSDNRVYYYGDVPARNPRGGKEVILSYLDYSDLSDDEYNSLQGESLKESVNDEGEFSWNNFSLKQGDLVDNDYDYDREEGTSEYEIIDTISNSVIGYAKVFYDNEDHANVYKLKFNTPDIPDKIRRMDFAGNYPLEYSDDLSSYCKWLDSELHKRLNESLKESVKDVTITTDDSRTTMTSEDDGKVTVTTEPVEKDEEEEEEEAEILAPVSDETEMEIEENSAEDMDAEIDDIDSDSFEESLSSVLKEQYDNVKSYKMSSCSFDNNDVVTVNGIIEFASGKKGNAQIKLESHTIDKQGNATFLTESSKLFSTRYLVSGNLKEKKFITESIRSKEDK